MARRRHTPEQIICKLREADRRLGEGAEVAEVARHLEVSEATYQRWRNQFGDCAGPTTGPWPAFRLERVTRIELRSELSLSGDTAVDAHGLS